MTKNYSYQLNNEQDKARYKSFMGFFGIAYKDYLAARTLINSNQLYRGVILANTSIEKYFKVFLAVKGNKKRTHNVEKLLKTIKNFDQGLGNEINEDFIKFLGKSYNMRYVDNDVFNDSKNEFNICICKNKVLAELDFTVNAIESGWIITKDNEKIVRRYESDMRNRNEILFKNNYLFSTLSKKEFIENQKEYVLELRNTKEMGLLEVNYETFNGKDDGIFNKEALAPKTPSDIT